MQRAWTLVGGLVILAAAAGLPGCSSADTPEDGGDDGTGGATGGSAGSATGGTAPTGGTAGSDMGGTAGSDTGGTAGDTGGTTTTGGSGGGGGVNTDPECKGIKSNMSCPIEGKMCPNLVCGLADSGTRECNCATNWTCTSCDYTNSWVRDRPADIPACPAEATDEAPCLENMTVCGPVGSEYCACYTDATDGLIWDCDSPPSSWM